MFYSSIASSDCSSNSYATVTAAQAENAAREAQTKIEIFKHDIDRLLLITEAMWTFMKQEHGYTDDKLVQMIQDIEHRRTLANGAISKDPPVACPSCGRNNTVSRPFCMYCGKPLKMNPFAR
jgi:hypothetical protein